MSIKVEGWLILTHDGEIWIDKIFYDEPEARQYLINHWRTEFPKNGEFPRIVKGIAKLKVKEWK